MTQQKPARDYTVFGRKPLQMIIEKAVTNGLGFKNCFDGVEVEMFRDAETQRRRQKWDSDFDLQMHLAHMEFSVALSKGIGYFLHFSAEPRGELFKSSELVYLARYCDSKGIDLHEFNTPEKIEDLWQEKKKDIQDILNAEFADTPAEATMPYHIIG